MRGAHLVVVRNNRVQYKFTINRNITVLRGDSATGKTTLISMIADRENNGEDSGVYLSCDVPCVTLAGRDWESRLGRISGSIVFIDEGNGFVTSNDFARAVARSDNYYVIAVREGLGSLPYSVDEIYGIKNDTRQRYQGIRRVYSSFQRIYSPAADFLTPDRVIVEDPGSGYEFFSALCARSGIECVSARGKTNVFNLLLESGRDERLLVIADGAAFGSEIERVLSLSRVRSAELFLPESFEWLVLQSGLVRDDELPELLEHPADFIESREYLSWERFFTAALVERTAGTYLHYEKGRLNQAYLTDGAIGQMRSAMPEIGL